MSARESLTGVILAGGLGTRLGVPKAQVLLGGRPMIDYVLDALDPIVDRIIVVCAADIAPPPAVSSRARVITDAVAGQGPLRGLASGIAGIPEGLAIVVGCDMPFLNSRLLAWLASQIGSADAVIPIFAGRPQPLHAVYRPGRVAATAARVLATGKRSLNELTQHLNVIWMQPLAWEEIAPQSRSFHNINTPDDLAAAERSL